MQDDLMTTDSKEDARAKAKSAARALFWQGWRISHIATAVGIPRTTVQEWRMAEKWDDAMPLDRVQGAIEARLVQLIAKDGKSNGDYKEIDSLGRQIERMARVERYKTTGKESDLNPELSKRNASAKRKPTINAFSEDQVKKLEDVFLSGLFEYQRIWHKNRHLRTRFNLKSRQIGATYYFSREALIDAIKTGNNKIFLSASKAQAYVFKNYIKKFAQEADVELKGENFTLWNGAQLIFLGTNSATAQSYTGDLYFDEVFWVPKFAELNKVASGMAMHKKWRKTYFSTPSSITHEAYEMWSGARYNKNRSRDQRIQIDLSHSVLKNGHMGEDKVWRMITTVMDARAGGCDLFDIDDLRLEYSKDEFENLLMCQFTDDKQSVFPMAELQRCMVDSWEVWAHDYKPFTQRPYGYKPVWIGYDPNKGTMAGDGAACAVVGPPEKQGGKFRILEKLQWKGLDYEAQAGEIEKLTRKYNVTAINIDTTGLGHAVLLNVLKFFPNAKAYDYSLESKTALVLKAKSLISKGRVEFDAGWTDLAAHFMAIKEVLTPSGRSTTYSAGRSATTGHADLAFACMHAFIEEGLDNNAHESSILEISS